jgi:hypothetical protein
MDACYVAQTHAGVDCGKPVYPVCLYNIFQHHPLLTSPTCIPSSLLKFSKLTLPNRTAALLPPQSSSKLAAVPAAARAPTAKSASCQTAAVICTPAAAPVSAQTTTAVVTGTSSAQTAAGAVSRMMHALRAARRIAMASVLSTKWFSWECGRGVWSGRAFDSGVLTYFWDRLVRVVRTT